MVIKTHLTLIALIAGQASATQVCIDEAINPIGFVEADARYEINEAEGVVLDRTTGMMWQQCEIGLNYDAENKACTGDIQTFSWQQALLEANDNSYGGYTDWHMPNLKELASIVSHHCANPALDTEVFLFSKELLNVEEQNYWTSTTVSALPSYAWTFQVSDGKNRRLIKTAGGRLRLVRYAK